MYKINPFLIIILFCFGCNNDAITPKPTAYPRLDLPVQKYQKMAADCPYTFDVSTIANITHAPQANAPAYWYNINYANQQAVIYLTYKPLSSKLELIRATEDAHKLTFKHTVKASAIEESFINKKENRVYGILYDVAGNAASPIQFFVTDSNRHFLSAALYFNASPNADSIAPVVQYFKQDIMQLIDSFEWRN